MIFYFSSKSNYLKEYMEEDMIEMFAKFYNMETKTQQDINIQSLMEICLIERQRPRPASSSRKSRNFNVKYHST